MTIQALSSNLSFSASRKRYSGVFLDIKPQELEPLIDTVGHHPKGMLGGSVEVRYSQTSKAHYWTVNKRTHAGHPGQRDPQKIVIAFQVAQSKKTGKVGVTQVMTKEGDHTGLYSKQWLAKNPEKKVPDLVDQIDYWTKIFLNAKYKVVN